MINNPQLGLPQLTLSAQTPVASVTVTVTGGSEADAIVVTASTTGAGSLLDAALGESAAAPQAGAAQASASQAPAAPGAGTPAGYGTAGNAGFGSPNGTAQSGYAAQTGAGSGGISANAELGAAFAARSLEATIAAFTSASAGSAVSSPLGNAALARLLVAAALGQSGGAAALSKGAAASLAAAASLLRAASTATSPAVAATLLGELENAIANGEPELARAAAQLQQPSQQQPGGIFIPPWDPNARLGRADKKKAVAEIRDDAEEPERPVALPDRDPQGRPYDFRQRMRLARLAADPRSGYASEGRVALAAEIEHGVRLERTYDTSFDFADASGGRWNALEPDAVAGLESALNRPGGAHAIVSAALLGAGDRVALDALVERLTRRAGAPRILIVNEGDAK